MWPPSGLAIALLLSLSMFVPSIASAAGLIGKWDGAVQLPTAALQIRIQFDSSASGLSARIDVPQQGATGLALQEVRLEGTKLHMLLAIQPYPATFEGTVAGDSISGTMQQAGQTFPFHLTPAGTGPEAVKSPPPPYRQEEVTVDRGTFRLAGTLTVPRSPGRHAAVILITGSGAQNRDEELFGFKIFGVIADRLTREGVAVLRVDDRGVGGSTGRSDSATSADFCGDVLAELAFLKIRPEIDPLRIGLLGHSEGGIIAPMAAERSRGISFLVLMSGSGVTGDRILLAQGELLMRAAGAGDSALARQRAIQLMGFRAIDGSGSWDSVSTAVRAAIRSSLADLTEEQRKGIADPEQLVEAKSRAQLSLLRSPWMKFFVEYDPAPALGRTRCPVLALFGERDLQVPAALNRPAMEAALRRGGNRDVEFVTVPRANHLYQPCVSGSAGEYASLPKQFAPGFLDTLSAWIIRHTRPGRRK